MSSTRSPLAIAFLAIIILALGFVAGLGYQSLQHAQQNTPNGRSKPSPLAPAAVRHMRVSPDDRLLAFTALYNSNQQAGRFVFDLQTYKWSEATTPPGWQDSIVQWNGNARSLLFHRERTPRPVDNVTAGPHRETIAIQDNAVMRMEAEPVGEDLKPGDERSVAAFWTPDGRLVVKTRRESKALFWEQNGETKLVDRSPGTYYQNRVVKENGQNVFYVVRDESIAEGTVVVLRIANGRARQLGSDLSGVVWAYLSENSRWMVVCRYAENNKDWEWSLYRVSPDLLELVKTAVVPQDVIAVYWSPDHTQILGAAGKSLWLISMPNLKVKQLGTRNDWNADDAVWLNKQDAVLVAAGGHLWKVSTRNGARREIWKFPDQYWK